METHHMSRVSLEAEAHREGHDRTRRCSYTSRSMVFVPSAKVFLYK